MGTLGSRAIIQKSNESVRLVLAVFVGSVFGFLAGISFPTFLYSQLNISSSIVCGFSDVGNKITENSSQMSRDALIPPIDNRNNNSLQIRNMIDPFKIWVPSNPRGAQRLPPAIVVNESDFFLRRLWGNPSEDITHKPKYLVTFTVGINQKHNIDAAVKKFSDNFTVLLFHYDGNTSEWDEFEWSKRAIHVSARKQTKWWYAKRFLHPSVVAPYDYIFIWDEDLGVEHFNAEEYINVVKRHGLQISQPALDPPIGVTWMMTKRRADFEVHKEPEEKPSWCSHPLRPPCEGFVEIMAPVFSRDAWRCVWHMIQNDLVHGWGLDFVLQHCVENAHEEIGIVDAQWIFHQSIPSLGDQGQEKKGKAPWKGVRERCHSEWTIFQTRFSDAEKAYYKEKGIEA